MIGLTKEKKKVGKRPTFFFQRFLPKKIIQFAWFLFYDGVNLAYAFRTRSACGFILFFPEVIIESQNLLFAISFRILI